METPGIMPNSFKNFLVESLALQTSITASFPGESIVKGIIIIPYHLNDNHIIYLWLILALIFLRQ